MDHLVEYGPSFGNYFQADPRAVLAPWRQTARPGVLALELDGQR